MNWNRIVVGAIAVLAVVVVYDALQGDDKTVRRSSLGDYRIDLASSRAGSPLPASMLIEAFPGRRPGSLAVSKVAVDPHGTMALGVSHVPGNEPPRAAIELWRGEQHLSLLLGPAGLVRRWAVVHGRRRDRDDRLGRTRLPLRPERQAAERHAPTSRTRPDEALRLGAPGRSGVRRVPRRRVGRPGRAATASCSSS